MDIPDGGLTEEDFSIYRSSRAEYTERNIDMYIDYRLRKKTIYDIAQVNNMTQQGVRKRLRSFIGEVNKLKALRK